jgi:murein endopeptidase
MSVRAPHDDFVLDPCPEPTLTPAGRDTVEVVSLVRADRRGIDPGRWTPAVAALIKLAAGLPEVARILVNPAIKCQLCNEVTGDRTWLHLIRPWYGHAAYMHVSFVARPDRGSACRCRRRAMGAMPHCSVVRPIGRSAEAPGARAAVARGLQGDHGGGG